MATNTSIKQPQMTRSGEQPRTIPPMAPASPDKAETGEHTLPVKFDAATWKLVQTLATMTGSTRTGVVRKAVRLLARVASRVDDGYEVAFLKKGENPIILELG